MSTTALDAEELARHLERPHSAWGHDLTARGLVPDPRSRAYGLALQISGAEPDTPAHTAVWLVLALAGYRRIGACGSEVSLGAHAGAAAGPAAGVDRRLLQAIGIPGQAAEQTVKAVAELCRSRPGPAGRPDPVVLAADLAVMFGEDPDARRAVANRWSKDHRSARASRA
ncbi:hypothetical protein [Nocardiopsis synnemataformans]|uniref:hypothetical protein n=1 Tax=Nocardiopsis synnemataformans TaxID=61305 RepID=UPI003EC12BEA